MGAPFARLGAEWIGRRAAGIGGTSGVPRRTGLVLCQPGADVVCARGRGDGPGPLARRPPGLAIIRAATHGGRAMNFLGLVFVLGFVALFVLFSALAQRKGARPVALREIEAFSRLPVTVGQAVETGRRLHI